jgi:hypothetical protein
LLVIALLVAPGVFAQTTIILPPSPISNPAPVPVGPIRTVGGGTVAVLPTFGNVQYSANLQTQIDNFTDTHVDLFSGTALNWLNDAFFIMLFITVMHYVLSPTGSADPAPIVSLLARWAIAFTILSFWNSPFPWAGVSAHALIQSETTWISSKIDLSCVDRLEQYYAAMSQNTVVPGTTDFIGGITYCLFGYIVMPVIHFLSYAVTLTGPIANAVGALVGPFFIPWYLTRSFEWLFWGFVRFTLIYSFWRVVASAITFIWLNDILSYLAVAFGASPASADWSMGSLAHVLPYLIGDMFGFAVCILGSGAMTRDLFSGGMSTGNAVGMIASAIKTVVNLVK